MNTHREHLKREEQSRERRNSGDFYYLIAETLTKALSSKYMFWSHKNQLCPYKKKGGGCIAFLSK